MVYLIFAALLIAAEQLIKTRIRKMNGKKEFLHGFFQINPIKNKGILFGLLKNNSIFPLFIQTGALVLLTVFAVPALFSGNTRPLIKLGVALMVSGAGENVLDRLIYGGVLDYLQFPKLKWIGKIVFDLADFFLLLGSLILVIVTVL